MQLSSRQARIFTLATILSTGKPVAASYIVATLECSEPTLTRALKELRESYAAEIKYSKATHSYQLVNPGLLDKKTLKRMSDVLALSAEVKAAETAYRVTLDKDKKTAVSLSLRMRIVRKIDKLAQLTGKTRSEAVELMAEKALDTLLYEAKVNSKGSNSPP